MDLHTLIQAQMELDGQRPTSCFLRSSWCYKKKRNRTSNWISPKINSQHRTRRAFRIWLSHQCRDLQKREAKILITANPNNTIRKMYYDFLIEQFQTLHSLDLNDLSAMYRKKERDCKWDCKWDCKLYNIIAYVYGWKIG